MNILIYIIAGITVINLLCLLNRKQRNNWEDLWYDTIIKSFEHLKGQNGLVKYSRFIIFLILIPLMLTTFLLVAP